MSATGEARTPGGRRETGREAAALVMAAFDRQAGNAGRWGGVGPDRMAATQSTLARLDRFWTDIMVYQI